MRPPDLRHYAAKGVRKAELARWRNCHLTPINRILAPTVSTVSVPLCQPCVRSSVMRTSARLFITTAILATAVLMTAAPTAAQATAYAPTYLDPIDLGTLGGNETRAYAA